MSDFISALSSAVRSPDDAEGRYYGMVAGVVTDVTDPKSLGRVKARLRGFADDTDSDWLVPMWPGAIEGIPRKGDPVLVCFEDGDVHRGFYAWHASTKTNDRPNEWMVLGLTLAGMFNQLRSDLQVLVTAFNAHKHTGVTTGGGTSAVSDTLTFAPTGYINAGEMQRADGSSVSAVSGSQKALSGRAKVGI